MLSEQKKKLRAIWAASATSSDSSPTTPCLPDAINVIGGNETSEAVQFIAEETMKSIQECVGSSECPDTREDPVLQEILPTTASMGLTQTIEESMQIRPSEQEPEESSNLDLEGIDDDEIDSYILTNREKELKTKLWMNLNKDFLEEQAKKKNQERLEEEQREREGKPPKRQKVHKKRKENELPANTAGEAIERLVKVKKLSNKIDYNVLRSLNGETEASANCQLPGAATNARSVTSRASSRSNGSSKRSAAGQNVIPGSFCKLHDIMQSITGAKTPMEAMQLELAEEEGEEPQIFKRMEEEEQQQQLMLQNGRVTEEDEEEIEEEEEEEEDDDDGLEEFRRRIACGDM